MARYAGLVTMSLAAVLVAGCQNSAPKMAAPQASTVQSTIPTAAHRRTSTEIRQAIGKEGMTGWGHDIQGHHFVSYTAPNGTIVVKSGTFMDHGVWHVAPNGEWCVRWNKIRNGVETCLTQYVKGNDVYNVFPDGKLDSVETRSVQGNPDHL